MLGRGATGLVSARGVRFSATLQPMGEGAERFEGLVVAELVPVEEAMMKIPTARIAVVTVPAALLHSFFR